METNIPIQIEELDYQATSMGEISLRRRHDLELDAEIYEVKLGDEFLMSSMFTVAEIEMAHLGLAAAIGEDLSVLVGGLGLGYTARAALEDSRVRELTVIEALAPVIDWHRRNLIPYAAELTGDPRASLVHGDFFASMQPPESSEASAHRDRYDVILLDIDHSPDHLLHPAHADFYTPTGLSQLADRLEPSGVLAIWSNDPPDQDFLTVLGDVFETTDSHVVSFPNPLQDTEATNTVYIATKAPGY